MNTLPDIYQLRCFLAVVEKKNFSKAAESLFISRQALTKTVQRIEEALGAPLFESCGRVLELTPLGRALYNHAIPLMKSWEIFEDNMHQYMAHQKMMLQIVFSHGTLLSLGRDIFRPFRKDHPNIHLSSEEMSPDAVTKLIRSGEADIGIIGSIPEYLTEFHVICLRRTGMWLQFSANNPLSQKDILIPADLVGKPFIGPGPRNHQHQFFTRECRRAGVEPNYITNMSYNTVRNIPQEKDAFYYAFPESICPPMEGFVVRRIKLPGDEQFGTYAITKKGRLSIPAKQFMEYLQAQQFAAVEGIIE